MDEAIRLEARNQGDARRLADALDGFAADVHRDETHWEVVIEPGREAAASLVEAVESIGRWLVESRQSSCRIHFGERTYVFLQPTDGRPSDSAEFLLERTIQLQTALESRIVIEQAKGVLAGRLGLSIDDAFALLRRAARSNGTKIHDLAAEIVASRETPARVLAVTQQADRRR